MANKRLGEKNLLIFGFQNVTYTEKLKAMARGVPLQTPMASSFKVLTPSLQEILQKTK